MPDYQPGLVYQGIAQGLAAFGEAQEEQKTRAREFKALQEFADATGIAGKDQTTVMDLDSLKGFVRGAEGKRAIDEQKRKAQLQEQQAQLQQAQFEEQKAQHIFQRGQAATDTLFRGLGAYQSNRSHNLAEQDFNLRQQTHADVLKRQQQAAAQEETQRTAVGGLVRDFNQFAEGPQFNGTGMQRPMGQFEAYRRALGANPRAITPQMVDDLGRMAVSKDRFSQSGSGASEPSIFTSPNGRTYIRHGNNPLVRDKTDEEIAAELASRTAPRAMAPEGSVEATLNGVKVLVGTDGRIYKMPAANPLAALFDQAANAPAPETLGSRISGWWRGGPTSTPSTNAPPPATAAPTSGKPVVRWGLDSKGNPVKLP